MASSGSASSSASTTASATDSKTEQAAAAAKALSAIAAAFQRDATKAAKPVAAGSAGATPAANSTAAWGAAGGAPGAMAGAAAALKNMSLAEQQRVVQAALDALGGGNGPAKPSAASGAVVADDEDSSGSGGAGGAGGHTNLAKVQKKDKPQAADPRHDPTKLVSVPCFICRPSEWKLLRDSMTDRNTYASNYTEYLQEMYEFCHEMAAKQHCQVLRGTWDVAHYLQWCSERQQKPRATSRKQYFEELAKLCVARKMDEPKPSFEQYLSDTQEGGLLRYCCRLGSEGKLRPARLIGAAADAADADTADAKGDGKAAAKTKADPPCGKLETKPSEFALCAGCKCAVYCSVECQKKDWKTHKKWCAKAD